MGSALVASLAVIGGVLTIVGAAASTWAYFKSKQMASTLDLLSTANAELRGIVEDYKNQTAELRGQVAALQSEVVLGLVTMAQDALKKAITDAIAQGFAEGKRRADG